MRLSASIWFPFGGSIIFIYWPRYKTRLTVKYHIKCKISKRVKSGKRSISTLSIPLFPALYAGINVKIRKSKITYFVTYRCRIHIVTLWTSKTSPYNESAVYMCKLKIFSNCNAWLLAYIVFTLYALKRKFLYIFFGI